MMKCFAFIFLWIATILRIAKSRNEDSWYRLLRIAFVMQDLQSKPCNDESGIFTPHNDKKITQSLRIYPKPTT